MRSLYLAKSYNFIASLQEVKFRYAKFQNWREYNYTLKFHLKDHKSPF